MKGSPWDPPPTKLAWMPPLEEPPYPACHWCRLKVITTKASSYQPLMATLAKLRCPSVVVFVVVSTNITPKTKSCSGPQLIDAHDNDVLHVSHSETHENYNVWHMQDIIAMSIN